MPLPERKADLEAMGYLFDNEARCGGCEAEIEWWITPTGKKMPMSVIALDAQGQKVVNPIAPVHEYVRRPHWSDCPNADDFRKKK